MVKPLLPEASLRTGSRTLRRAMEALHGAAEPPPPMRISVRGLVHHAALLTGMSVEELLGKSRWQRLTRVRHAIAMVAVQYPHSYPQIGKAMGGRDHSTVINSRKRASALMERDPDFAWFFERLWAVAECEPLGPGNTAPPMHAVAEPPPLHVPPPAITVEAGEDAGSEDQAEDPAICRIEAGSRQLLERLHYEHPERVPALPKFRSRSPAVRLGNTMGAI